MYFPLHLRPLNFLQAAEGTQWTNIVSPASNTSHPPEEVNDGKADDPWNITFDRETKRPKMAVQSKLPPPSLALVVTVSALLEKRTSKGPTRGTYDCS